jgi:hypothetical protein
MKIPAELEKLAKELRNKKAKEWRNKNKLKVKEINQRYWLKKAKAELEKKEREKSEQ